MIDQCKEEENQMYNHLVTDSLNMNLIKQYASKNAQIQFLIRKVVAENDQQMKLNWLTKGERPTNFFYKWVNVSKPNQKNNVILNTYGSWIST